MLPIGPLANQPKNINFLLPHRFRVNVRRLPNVVYYCQEVNIPGLSTGSAMQPTPFANVQLPGNKLTFEDLTITFSIDEDMQNYREIQRWIRGTSMPYSFDQFKALAQYSLSNNAYDGATSDIYLTVLDNSENPTVQIVFSGCFPVSIGAVQFDSKMTDATSVSVSATFKYTLYTFVDNPSSDLVATMGA